MRRVGGRFGGRATAGPAAWPAREEDPDAQRHECEIEGQPIRLLKAAQILGAGLTNAGLELRARRALPGRRRILIGADTWRLTESNAGCGTALLDDLTLGLLLK